MDIIVDLNLCIGSGMCTATVPTVFELDTDGQHVHLLQRRAETPADIAAVQDAAACCPVQAITVQPPGA